MTSHQHRGDTWTSAGRCRARSGAGPTITQVSERTRIRERSSEISNATLLGVRRGLLCARSYPRYREGVRNRPGPRSRIRYRQRASQRCRGAGSRAHLLGQHPDADTDPARPPTTASMFTFLVLAVDRAAAVGFPLDFDGQFQAAPAPAERHCGRALSGREARYRGSVRHAARDYRGRGVPAWPAAGLRASPAAASPACSDSLHWRSSASWCTCLSPAARTALRRHRGRTTVPARQRSTRARRRRPAAPPDLTLLRPALGGERSRVRPVSGP